MLSFMRYVIDMIIIFKDQHLDRIVLFKPVARSNLVIPSCVWIFRRIANEKFKAEVLTLSVVADEKRQRREISGRESSLLGCKKSKWQRDVVYGGRDWSMVWYEQSINRFYGDMPVC